jgi:DNA-binding response OmpR family regulator
VRWNAAAVRQQRGLGANDPFPDYDDGRLRVRPADYIAAVDGVILRLKPRELGLLAALASQPDRIITREELLATVWDPSDEIASRAVDACVARLRATLAAALPDLRYIHTHARIGYRFGQEPATHERTRPRLASTSTRVVPWTPPAA